MSRARTPTALPVYAPMLATTAPLPRDEAHWAAEVKWDGMRVLVYVPGDGSVHVRSRTGAEATERFPELAAVAEALGDTAAVLDGEVVALGVNGSPSFGALQERMSLRRPAQIQAARHSTPVTLMVFDVLNRDGHDLTRLPYSARRARLLELPLDQEHGPVRTPPAWLGDLRSAVEWTEAYGIEGIVAKRLDSLYEPGRRSRAWIKHKHRQSLDVRLGGWLGEPRSGGLRSVLVGLPERGALRYLGAVGSGIGVHEGEDLLVLLRHLETDVSPFLGTPADLGRPDSTVHWASPALTAEVEYQELTAGGILRQPVWKGLREVTPEA
ncbi:ATP-dependent DNA ligase [Streptacidiphilus pinicola]|uniref:DNA ligase (ATP) n=1 Tax=Streptacidiphilus pinicola TaxID=2219663 RepID=A0A2X0IA21_9ACTN|nr:non-homologous end-joining DNA ligase [Streptacidiphilus pinicola]RAG81822.1 ATP-dependent DNA ligase [Streptacidiphilus pinicola]